MKRQNTRRGFTLIELLVVVLIIGILAAVALPQYNKAVRKSRLAQIESDLRALAQAAAVCKLAKGSACTQSELDIEVPPCEPIGVTLMESFCFYWVSSRSVGVQGDYFADMFIYYFEQPSGQEAALSPWKLYSYRELPEIGFVKKIKIGGNAYWTDL